MKNKINENEIAGIISKQGRQGISFKDLAKRANMKKGRRQILREVLVQGEINGDIVFKKDKFYSSSALGFYKGYIDRVNKTFGFAKRSKDDEQVFVPGKFLKGTLPQDIVLLKDIPTRGDTREGRVVKLLEKGPSQFTGILLSENECFYVLPDNFTKHPIAVIKNGLGNAKAGDKVLARVVVRGERHSNHRCKVLSAFGDAQNAESCSRAILEANNISLSFSGTVMEEASYLSDRRISQEELDQREDLRDQIIFTIDGADSKDLDDAVSLDKMEDSYRLGVHIADVSYYVKHRSALDLEAFERGTSVYYANKVVPMLPKELSNGICSLNPGEDRLAFSVFMILDLDGRLLDFEFQKTVIHSRVKGVYGEINKLLEGTADQAVEQKYAQVKDTLFLMEELAKKRQILKAGRGAPQIETRESKIIVDENGYTVEVRPHETGLSEGIIEEFMLLANEAAATLGKTENLPFVYRVHEIPPEDKVKTLRELLGLLGLPVGKIRRGVKPAVLADVLLKAKGTKIYSIVNTQILRSMSKAKYSTNPIGHYGLALENYAHFTSPIRRYPDLTIHRILSEYLAAKSPAALQRKYAKFAEKSALRSSAMEVRAMKVERDCEDSYKAEYMKQHIGEEYEGVISGLAEHGMYVELPNTVEGLIRTEQIPGGVYKYDGLLSIQEVNGSRKFQIGDAVRIKCIGADVNAGNIDFELLLEGIQ